MIEPDFLNRDIETLDIWSIERELFLKDLSSEKRIELVEDKLIGQILSKKAHQERRGDSVKIEPFTDLKRYDSGEHKGYYDRYERQLREAQTTKERIALNIFQVRNSFYSLDENFRIEFDDDFDFWFALKVSQYDYGLKHVDGSVTDTETRPKMKPTVSTTQARICGMVASVRADYSDCVWQSRADQMLADHGAPG